MVLYLLTPHVFRIQHCFYSIKLFISGLLFQILQKYFSGWYSVLMERRLAMGKAKATADWKLLLRTFNAWKAYTRSKHLDTQTLNHEQSLKQLHR